MPVLPAFKPASAGLTNRHGIGPTGKAGAVRTRAASTSKRQTSAPKPHGRQCGLKLWPSNHCSAQRDASVVFEARGSEVASSLYRHRVGGCGSFILSTRRLKHKDGPSRGQFQLRHGLRGRIQSLCGRHSRIALHPANNDG